MPKHPIVTTSERIVEHLLTLCQEHRENALLNKNQAAALARISPQMVGYIESRERTPSLSVCVQMLLGMGHRPSKVLEEAEERAGITRPHRQRMAEGA